MEYFCSLCSLDDEFKMLYFICFNINVKFNFNFCLGIIN